MQSGLCWTWSETTLLVFPRGGSFVTPEKEIRNPDMLDDLWFQFILTEKEVQAKTKIWMAENADYLQAQKGIVGLTQNTEI